MWNIFYTFARMKKTNCIKKVIRCAALCAAALLVASCAEKPKSDNIIVHKRAKVQKKQTQAMSGYEDKRNVEWLGATYKVCVERKSDNTLPLTYDEQGNSYYDNRISVRVLRSDGSCSSSARSSRPTSRSTSATHTRRERCSEWCSTALTATVCALRQASVRPTR